MFEVIIKSAGEIDAMRAACRLAAQTLEETGKIIKPGISTEDINTFVHEYTIQHHGIPAPLNYEGFPKSVCTSINDVVCHGIPSKKDVLREGDIINVDVTTILDGWHGDVNATFYVGTPSQDAIDLVETTRQCLTAGIQQVKPKARVGDIGSAIQTLAEDRHFSVVRAYVGHGIGRKFHENLQIPHFGRRNFGLRLIPGMTFTIEPMINQGKKSLHVGADQWTARTDDGKLSAQFEHTILVTETGCEVMTEFSGPLVNSEVRPTTFDKQNS